MGNCIKKHPALALFNKFDAELLGSLPKFHVNIKLQLMQPVFPDYLSVSYDYDFIVLYYRFLLLI